jgi:uncharacterized protein (DUF362 family)/Pyruvate/2-oxoacid:ferredoxin oxidoreductase delta subunit
MEHAPLEPVTVAFRRCREYDASLPQALDELLADLGGWERLVPPGTTVLVKPNLLTDRTPELAVTTHPALVRAVVLRVPLVSFEQRGSRSVVSGGQAFNVAVDALDVQLIVNLPKVKTHGLTTLTAAVKNLYGVLPGYQKTQRHKEHSHPSDFGRYVRALLDTLPALLTIADGVVGMEGEGPSNGTPVRLGFLAASMNPVSLDLALCRALRIPPRRVPYLVDDLAAGRGSNYTWVGTPLAELALPPFKLPPPSPTRFLPRFLVKLVSPYVWVRPSFNANCIRCSRCVNACPVKALQLGDSPTPVLDGALCIGCCCCHEVCPAKAIRMRQSPLLRLVGAFKGM